MIDFIKAVYRYFFCVRDPRVKSDDWYERAIVQSKTIEQLHELVRKTNDERDEARQVAAQYYEKSQRCCKTCAAGYDLVVGGYGCRLWHVDSDECRSVGGYPNWRKR